MAPRTDLPRAEAGVHRTFADGTAERSSTRVDTAVTVRAAAKAVMIPAADKAAAAAVTVQHMTRLTVSFEAVSLISEESRSGSGSAPSRQTTSGRSDWSSRDTASIRTLREPGILFRLSIPVRNRIYP